MNSYFNENTYEELLEEIKYVYKSDSRPWIIGYSGGKDSTVTSHIVNRALGTNKVLHVFGDTTLEFPYTLEYKKRRCNFKKLFRCYTIYKSNNRN